MRILFVILVISLYIFSPLPASAQPFFRVSPKCDDGTFPKTVGKSLNFTGAGNQEVVAGVASKKIEIWHFFLFSTTSGVTVKFTEGTGSNCGTGTADLGARLAQYSAANQTLDSTTMSKPMITNTAADALCLNSSGVAVIDVTLIECQE